MGTKVQSYKSYIVRGIINSISFVGGAFIVWLISKDKSMESGRIDVVLGGSIGIVLLSIGLIIAKFIKERTNASKQK